ncbi:hypothetical protein HNQ77_001131 [Silvibacterium bohemicum]|uniref:Uncharacterized protein n=1 Tax=Silvibacterium bohemicum TaxID=1577686 RepID=A0A841JRN8_9BACT|nr:hypothetical protein [Silvibacterium bohemicum]MBB6143187.1 hypothetical protein [Silvibacterium bohemicum]
MQYARILSLIDAELDRLREARQLLASCFSFAPPSPERAQKGGRQKRAEKTTSFQAQQVVIETASGAASGVVMPQKPGIDAGITLVKPAKRAPARRKPAVEKVLVAPPEKPLAGVIPERPVFVPAGQIHHVDALKQQRTQDQGNVDPAPADSLTAELLKQKWFHGLSS